ncbi:hypothetical protein JRQ81_003405 [Phrynocephalus forsythii]|uniref:Uncharacterized protein n=1 Tax=Phrynocephalus forsythii TaxID=171643 RepID=A0A9Q0XM03_9SAUR|nr:hypothetical protein JRQ81_003405 [Phrynocephalus forsythii]
MPDILKKSPLPQQEVGSTLSVSKGYQMGHNAFPKLHKPCMSQMWLLAVCLLLGLRSEVDAVTCSDCTIYFPGVFSTCRSPSGTCTVENGLCMIMKYYEGRYLKKVVRTCVEQTSTMCGQQLSQHHDLQWHETSCFKDET